jgi:hypothetical protein
MGSADRSERLENCRDHSGASIQDRCARRVHAVCRRTAARRSREGVSSFTRTFAERGPRDHKGRSLREFDLRTRLFRYPLSYMVYDAAFDALPGPVLDQVYRRLFDVLTEQEGRTFPGLARADRRAILEILKDTKSNLPAYWRAGG